MRFAFVSALLFATLAFAGCLGGDGEPSDGTTPDTIRDWSAPLASYLHDVSVADPNYS